MSLTFEIEKKVFIIIIIIITDIIQSSHCPSWTNKRGSNAIRCCVKMEKTSHFTHKDSSELLEVVST